MGHILLSILAWVGVLWATFLGLYVFIECLPLILGIAFFSLVVGFFVWSFHFVMLP